MVCKGFINARYGGVVDKSVLKNRKGVEWMGNNFCLKGSG